MQCTIHPSPFTRPFLLHCVQSISISSFCIYNYVRHNLTKWLSFCSSFNTLSTDASFIKIGVCCRELLSLEINLYYRYSRHSVHIKCPVLRVCECQVNTWRLSHIPLGSNLIPRPAWLSKSWVGPGNEALVPLKDSHIRLIHTHKASS